MKHSVLLALLFTLSWGLSAQWTISLQTGAALSLRPQGTDSVFAAKQQGLKAQATATYFFGHLGLGVSAGYVKMGLRNDAAATKPPSLIDSHFVSGGGGLALIPILAGPEVCVVCTPKFKMSLHWRGGVSIVQQDPVAFSRRSGGLVTRRYFSELKSKAPFTMAAGASGYYVTGRHTGIGLNLDYTSLKTTVINTDFRFAQPARTLSHKISLLNITTQFIYKF